MYGNRYQYIYGISWRSCVVTWIQAALCAAGGRCSVGLSIVGTLCSFLVQYPSYDTYIL